MKGKGESFLANGQSIQLVSYCPCSVICTTPPDGARDSSAISCSFSTVLNNIYIIGPDGTVSDSFKDFSVCHVCRPVATLNSYGASVVGLLASSESR